jgi:hypothetical protein
MCVLRIEMAGLPDLANCNPASQHKNLNTQYSYLNTNF